MTLPPLDQLKKLQAEATPGPWKYDPEVGEILGAYYEKNGMGYIPTVGYADDYNADLIALAPDLIAEVIRLREALEKQLYEVNLIIALAGMIQSKTEVQQEMITLTQEMITLTQEMITLTRAIRDDLTRILKGKK